VDGIKPRPVRLDYQPQPAVLFYQNKSTINKQPPVLFSQNEPALATSQTNMLLSKFGT
jgi:hypothetical protein